MGLDQYGNARPPDTKPDDKRRIELAYWRKHNRLQGWMENLWVKKGGKGEFNCVEVELTSKDLNELERIVEDKELPETTGFFFGSDSYGEYERYHKKTDLEFISKAKKEIKKGNKVYYSSWW